MGACQAVGHVNAPGSALGSGSTVELFVDSSSAGVFTKSTGGASAISWRVFNTSFAATGASTTLRLINRDGPNDVVNGLDNVTVEARTAVVPVPAALPLLVSGLALSGFLGRRQDPFSLFLFVRLSFSFPRAIVAPVTTPPRHPCASGRARSSGATLDWLIRLVKIDLTK